MPALDAGERRYVHDSLPGLTILFSTVARVYTASPDPRSWTYTGNWGALAFGHDGRSFTFKLVELPTTSKRVLWECDVSSGRDPAYELDRPTFHSFAGNGFMVGFAFADDGDARNFGSAVQQRDSRLAQVQGGPPPPTRQSSMTGLPAPSGKPSPAPSPATTPVAATAPSGGGMFGGMFGGKASKKTVKKSEISAPTGFQHLSHIGYTKGKGFDIQNIPPEWKDTLAKAGVTEAMLSDPKTAKFIANFMEDHGGEKPAQPSRRAPPPPPPSKRQPPPPPPPRAGGGGTAPTAPPPPPISSRPPPVAPVMNDVYSVPVSSGGPPPPPPPPPVGYSGGAPPPPPPPPVGYGGGAPPPPPMPPSSGGLAAPSGTSDLMASIRAGSSLKPVGSGGAAAPPTPEPAGGGDDIASALAAALAARKAAMTGDDDEEEEAEDDEEWK